MTGENSFSSKTIFSILLKSFYKEMSSTREILTLQFGNYSNYIGAHWWNIQESSFNYDSNASPSEVNHDILYREGHDSRGQTTYTPRLLLVDLSASLQHLPEEGSLYEDFQGVALTSNNTEKKIETVKQAIAWDQSAIEVIKKDPLSKPKFQTDLDDPDVDIEENDYNFSENVESWANYLYTRYHPRTINLIKEYKHSNEKETFDSFSNGMRIWDVEQFKYDFADKIRKYLEECDICQGFHIIFDCHNAFSGFTFKCMEHLNDEYGKDILAFPVFPPKSVLFENADDPMTDSIRTVNIALSYNRLSEKASLFVPLSTRDRAWRNLGTARKFPLLSYEEENRYQTSAILASFLDTATLRYRLRDAAGLSYLPGFCSDLTNYGRKLGAAAFSLPFPMRSDHDLIECLDKFNGQIFTQLSPNSKIGKDYVIQSACVRGIPRTRLKKPLHQAQQQMKMAAYKCNSVSEMFQLYFQCENHASLAHVVATQEGLSTKIPFPAEIFDTRINLHGYVQDISRSKHEKVTSVPTVASVQCSGDLADTIESLHREANRIKIQKLHRFKETGLEVDEYVEALENLLQFKDNYEDNYEL